MQQKRIQFCFWTEISDSKPLGRKHWTLTTRTVKTELIYCSRNSKWACIKMKVKQCLRLLLSTVAFETFFVVIFGCLI